MTTEVNLHQWGMGMTEGTVVMWLKSEGDSVIEDEDLAEVETGKVTELVIAPASGKLSRILVLPGETVAVYTTLALIDGA